MNSNISDLDVAKIRVLRKMGMRSPIIAKIFGITPANALQIARGTNWKSVKMEWTLGELQAVIVAHQNEWREIPSLRGLFWVHPSGLIRNNIMVLKATPSPKGYMKIHATANGRKYSFTVHKAVAEAFLGTRPDGLVVHHRDANTSNNCISNLEYTTPKENVGHSIAAQRHVTTCTNDKAARTRLMVQDMSEMLKLWKTGQYSLANLGERYGITGGHVGKLVRGKGRKKFPLPEEIIHHGL